MAREIWKPIPGYEGFYEASSLGRIRSTERIVITNRVKQNGNPVAERRRSIIRKPHLTRLGRPIVHLSKEGVKKTEVVHRLVCLAFHGLPTDGQIVAHNDGDMSNNKPSNLRWATHKENYADRYRHGTDIRGDKCYAAKLTWDDVAFIRKKEKSAKLLSEQFGVHQSAIYKIWRNEKWIIPEYT